MTWPGLSASAPDGLAWRNRPEAAPADTSDARGNDTLRPARSQVCTRPSALSPRVSEPPAASVRPFDEKATQRARSRKAFTVSDGLKVLYAMPPGRLEIHSVGTFGRKRLASRMSSRNAGDRSQRRTVPSSPAVATVSPAALKLTPFTRPRWPSRIAYVMRVRGLQSRTPPA